MITRSEFEQMLVREDAAAVFLSLSRAELAEMLGDETADMKDYDQKNCHHCYNLLEHSLRTLENISREDSDEDRYMKLKLAAFFLDIGKPRVAVWDRKKEQNHFNGHAAQSAVLAETILKRLGYDEAERSRILFFIRHHDDFMQYRIRVEEYQKRYFVCISPETVADRIRMNRQLGDNASLRDYRDLLRLCRADVRAQAETAVLNGVVKATAAEKLERQEKIGECLEKAFELLEREA